MRNRAKLRGRRAPTRGRFIVSALEEADVAARVSAEPWRAGHFQTGDIVEVEHRASLSDPPERAVGMVLGRHRRGVAASFRLLCKPDDMPLEYQFMLHSPLLLSITVRSEPRKRPRTRKIYYMRERVKQISLPKPTRRPMA